MGRRVVRGLCFHCPEFQDREELFALSDALLDEKHASPVVDDDEQGKDQPHRDEHDRRDERDDQVGGAFYEVFIHSPECPLKNKYTLL